MKRPEGLGGEKPAPPASTSGRVPRSASPNTAPRRTSAPSTARSTSPQSATRVPQRAGAAAAAPTPHTPNSARVSRAARRERRRDERAEVRRFTRRSRQRRLTATVTVGSLLVLVAGVAVVTLSPLMSLDTVQVVGTSRLDATVVGAALDEHLGTPLALLDDAQIRDDLAAFPLIRSFSTEVVPPHTLILRIVERAPIGAI
ncbi:MAG: hypothetical protein RLZZ608_1532, partial [Actinomycetota bacterium]